MASISDRPPEYAPVSVKPSAPPPYKEQTLYHHVVLEVIQPPKGQVNVAKEVKLREKMLKIASYTLAAIGAILVLVSSSYFLSAAFVNSSRLLIAESIFPYGVVALISSLQIYTIAESSNYPKPEVSLRLGPMNVRY